MALGSRSLLHIILPFLFALITVQASAASAGREGRIVGGYRTIPNLNDTNVIGIAKFAVDEHNKEAKTNLKFQSIAKGEYQVVAGYNYKLVITADDGAGVQKYLTVVYERPWQNFKALISFEKYQD